MIRVKLALIFVMMLAGGIFLWPAVKRWRDNGFESSGRGFLEPYVINQKNRKLIYGTFAKSREELVGNMPKPPDGYDLFTSKEEVPKDILRILPENSIPFLSGDSFQLIMAVRHRYRNEIFFWVAANDEAFQKLDVRFHPK